MSSITILLYMLHSNKRPPTCKLSSEYHVKQRKAEQSKSPRTPRSNKIQHQSKKDTTDSHKQISLEISNSVPVKNTRIALEVEEDMLLRIARRRHAIANC